MLFETRGSVVNEGAQGVFLDWGGQVSTDGRKADLGGEEPVEITVCVVLLGEYEQLETGDDNDRWSAEGPD